MRIWDVDPGYLNRQSLLGEHRELHGLVSIVVNGKTGYAKHPETIRWVGYGWALKMRHRQLACEMALRGYTDKSPVTTRSNNGVWPDKYIDHPERQFKLLKEKYLNKEQGRIPLPKNEQELWSHHKYSVLARNPELYKKIGRDVAQKTVEFAELAILLTDIIRQQPTEGGIKNSVQHMWGYVSDTAGIESSELNSWSLRKLLSMTQKKAMEGNVSYLINSTALGELMVWLKPG